LDLDSVFRKIFVVKYYDVVNECITFFNYSVDSDAVGKKN